MLFRFERINGENNGLLGEHISAVVNPETKQLFGLTRMMQHLNDEQAVLHAVALDKAVQFLQNVASDLMPKNILQPLLTKQKTKDKMEFKPTIQLGNVELHWINGHAEEINIENKKIVVHGMKVKMYLPDKNLWAWVIVDKEGNILTFERNIFWNFDKYQRETQMWLHDKWLKAHAVELKAQ